MLIANKEYDFLRENEYLKDKLIFLTYGGSYAYGTNNENSDIDIRGCALNSKADLLGLSNFEQYIDNKTDTTIYSFNKLISLLIKCNPNTIELLGCRPQDYFYINQYGQELIDNQHLFLSQTAFYSFAGYATDQLRRLENALARDRLAQPQQEKHIKESIARSITRYDNVNIDFFLDKSVKEELDTEIFVNANFSHYPIRDFKNILSDISMIIDSYGKINSRNSKKDDAHLNKHAMHLIRLYLMCLDILENEKIVTYREKEHNMLMDIRNGKYLKNDGTYDSSFFDMVNEYEKKLNYAKENTSLPKKPNLKQIEEFVISINERGVLK